MKKLLQLSALISLALSFNTYAEIFSKPVTLPSLNAYQIEQEGEFAHIKVHVNKGSADIKSVLSFYMQYPNEKVGDGRFFELTYNPQLDLYETYLQITNFYKIQVGSWVQMIDVNGKSAIFDIENKEYLGQPSFKTQINRYINCKSESGKILNFKELINNFVKIIIDGTDISAPQGKLDKISRNDGYEILNINNFKSMLPDSEKPIRHEVYVNGHYPVETFANVAFIFPIELGKNNIQNFTAYLMEGPKLNKMTKFTCDMELSDTIHPW